jgi:hypothetical protein
MDPWLSVPWLPMVWLGGGSAVHSDMDPWLSVPELPLVWPFTYLLTVTGNPAIHEIMDPWLSVPELPLVWRWRRPGCPTPCWTRGFLSQGYPWFSNLFYGNPAIHSDMDPWLSVPELPLVWRACHPFISISDLLRKRADMVSRLVKDQTVSPEHAEDLLRSSAESLGNLIIKIVVKNSIQT